MTTAGRNAKKQLRPECSHGLRHHDNGQTTDGIKDESHLRGYRRRYLRRRQKRLARGCIDSESQTNQKQSERILEIVDVAQLNDNRRQDDRYANGIADEEKDESALDLLQRPIRPRKAQSPRRRHPPLAIQTKNHGENERESCAEKELERQNDREVGESARTRRAADRVRTERREIAAVVNGVNDDDEAKRNEQRAEQFD